MKIIKAEDTIQFNRILQKYGYLEVARRSVNWSEGLAREIKFLYWGNVSPMKIRRFCIEDKLNNFKPFL